MIRSVNDLYSAHQMKKLNKYDLRHKRNIKVYELQMDAIYREAIREAVSISGTVGQIKPDTLFSFDDYPITRKRIENLMSGLKSRMQAVVLNGINTEWTLAKMSENFQRHNTAVITARTRKLGMLSRSVKRVD